MDVSVNEPAGLQKSKLFNNKVATAMKEFNRMWGLLRKLEQTPEWGDEDSAKEIVVLFTSILKELEELEFPDLTLKDADLRKKLNAERQMYEFAKRIIRNFIKTNGSFDFVGTPSITNVADSLSGPSRYFGGKGRFNVILSMPQDLSPIIIDPDLLTGVWMNLLRNALEAGATEIVINGENKDGMIMVNVRDIGHGIDPKDAGHIFEPFWTKGKSKGTGLGLYICQEVIRNAGGTIEVDSCTEQEQAAITNYSVKYPLTNKEKAGLRVSYPSIEKAMGSLMESIDLVLLRKGDLSVDEYTELKETAVMQALRGDVGRELSRRGVRIDLWRVLEPLCNLEVLFVTYIYSLKGIDAGKGSLSKQSFLKSLKRVKASLQDLRIVFRRLAQGQRLEQGTTFTIRLPVAQDIQPEPISGSGIKASRNCL